MEAFAWIYLLGKLNEKESSNSQDYEEEKPQKWWTAPVVMLGMGVMYAFVLIIG